MFKCSMSVICLVLVSFSFSVSAQDTDITKSKIKKLSESCASVPFTGIPKTTKQMFCSGGFNEIFVRYCIKANLDKNISGGSISISYIYQDDDNKEIEITVEMKCSDIEM